MIYNENDGYAQSSRNFTSSIDIDSEIISDISPINRCYDGLSFSSVQ